MPSTQNELKELLQVVPEWARFLDEIKSSLTTGSAAAGTISSPLFSLLEKVGPKAIYNALCASEKNRKTLSKLVRNHYLLLVATQILPRNATLRRFFQERRVDKDSQQGQITSIAARHRLPAVYTDRIFVASGGLAPYDADRTDIYRRTASYVDRVLRGEKPAELPFQQPTKYQLTINLKTAKALGLTIPETLLATADEVIQ